MVERRLTTLPRSPVERIPTETIAPTQYRPARHPVELSGEVCDRVLRSMFALHVGFEIQARCGLFPLAEHEEEERKGSPRWAGMRAAADRLIEQVACTHCMARGDCIGARK